MMPNFNLYGKIHDTYNHIYQTKPHITQNISRINSRMHHTESINKLDKSDKPDLVFYQSVKLLDQVANGIRYLYYSLHLQAEDV